MSGAQAPPDGASSDFTHCEALVREGDRDRYLATLFAPADKRPHLYALYAFSGEIARVRDSVSAPLPGELRLQWWRDALQGTAWGDARGNPVAAALLDTVERFRLPPQALIDLVDARVFDLYDDPMPTLNDLEGYCGETASALIRLAGIVLAEGADPGGAEAAGHAGVAYGITGLLRAFPWHARAGQVFIPADVMERHGVRREAIVAGQGGPGLAAALAEMRGHARRHLARARDLASTIDPRIGPAFLAVALVEAYLARMERRDYDPFTTIVDLPPLQRQWILWRGSRRLGRGRL